MLGTVPPRTTFADRPPELRSAYAKLFRARAHLDELQRVLPPLLNANAYMIRREVGPKPFQYLLRAHADVEIPDDLGPIIGDVVHNLGCALDYLAAQLVVLSGGEPNSNTSYPIHWNVPKGPVKLAGCVTVKPEIAETIRYFQHYSEGRWLGDSIFIVQQLDNFDKHNELIVVASGVRFGWHGVPETATQPVDSRIFRNPIKAGVVVAEYVFDSEPNYEPDLNFELEVRITESRMLTSRLKGLAEGVYYASVDNLLDTLGRHVENLMWQFWRYF
jgi:hypothetical protein